MLRDSLRQQAKALLPTATGALAAVRGNDTAVPRYFATDEKPFACHRARLRFDQATLQASLHRRHLDECADCARCPGVPETPTHVLLECPRYAPDRERFRQQVRRNREWTNARDDSGRSRLLLCGFNDHDAEQAASTFISALQQQRKF